MVLWIKSAVVGDGSEENPYRPILSDFLKERNIGANYTVAYHPNSKKPILALVRLKEDELEEVLRELEDGKLVEILDYKKFVKFVRKYKAFRRCWEDQPAWPAFKSMADGSGDPVETRYFRNDTHTVNGLSGYKLLTTSTDSLTDAVYTGECWNQGSVAYYYIHFYIRHSDGSKVELGDAYKSYSGDSGGTILVDDTCSIPAKTLYTSDAIEADPEIRVSGTSYIDNKWITDQLGATKLSSATWHVYWKIDQYYATVGDDTVLTAKLKLGDSDTRIENFSYGWQDYKKVINETVSVAEQITRVGGSESGGGGGSASWLSGWSYRKNIEIEGSSAGSVSNYQIKLKLHYGYGSDSGSDIYLNENCKTDFGDVRFTKDDGVTLLDYWMEEKVDSDYAVFWVEIPSIPASPDSVSIYVYYGKSDAVYDGDPEQVFDLYEDFDELADGEDPSGWTDYNNKWAVDSGWYRSSVYSGAESNWDVCCVNTGFEVSNHEIRLKVSRLHEGSIPNFYVFFRASDLGSDLSDVVDGYAAVLHGSNDELQLRRYDNGSATILSSASQTYGLEIYDVKIRAYGSSLEVECDSVSVSATDSTYSSGYLAFTKHNLDVKIDEVIVRKYIDPEPSISSVGDEEGAWMSGWSYRKKHKINGSSAGSVTDYQIRIKVHYGSGTDSGEDVYLNEKCRSDFGDVRFTDDDGTTVLDYWMEEKVDSDYAIFWIKVPSIPADPDKATIYVYYGKSDATYVGSGSDTFLVYEDWESGSIGSDWTKSQVDGSASYGDFETTSSVKYEGSYGLIFDAKSGGQSKQALHQSPGVGDYAIEAWIRNEMQSGYAHHVGVTIDYQSGNNTLYFLGIYSGSLTIKKWNGSSWGTLASGGSKSYNTWLKIKAYRLSSGLLKVTLEGETISANDTSYTSGGAGFFAHGGASQAGEAYYDLIFVRKYIDPEPSHGDWGSEETAGQDLVRVLIEEMAISEGRFGSRFMNRIRGETLSIIEAKMRILYLSRVLSETISVGEGSLWLRRLVRKVAETVNISEALVKAMSYVRFIAETVSLSELKNVARNIVRAIGETVDLTEAKLRFLNLCRVISESVSVSEAKDRFLQLARVVSETLSLEELTKWVRERIRVLTETIELSESASWIRSLTRKIGEIVSLVEARLRVLNLARIKDEIVGVQESVKWIRSLARVISETINVPESVTEVLSKVIVKIVDEAVSIAEGIARAIRLLRIKAESISIQEAFVKVMGLVRLVAENVGISEVKNRARAVVRFMAEVVSLEEVKARARSLARHFAESVSVEEAKNYVRGLMRIISEEIQLIEAKVIALSLSRIHDEVVELLEMKLRFRNLARVVGETLSLIESRLGIKQVIRVIGEMIDIDEASARFRTIIGQVVESVAILEDKLRVRQMICVVGETVSVLEEALSSLARAIIKVVSEVLEITEVKEFITLARRFLKGAITLLERSGTITVTVIRKGLSILKRRGEVEVEE